MLRAALSGVAMCSLATVLTLTGCSASQTLFIHRDGSGSTTLHIEVSKLLREYITSLNEATGASGSGSGTSAEGAAGSATSGDRIFDLGLTRKGFEAQPGVTVRSVSSVSPGVLDADLSFKSLPDIFARNADLGASQALVLSESGGLTTLRIHLDRSNYRQAAALFPLLDSPALQTLGPQVDQKVTTADYLEMIKFAIGDDGPGLVKKSSIIITVRPDGEIVSQSGGTVSGGAVVFRVSLLRLLVLDSPLDYSLTYR